MAAVALDWHTDPRGFDYYWFALEHIVHTPAHSTDLEAIEDGYVTVTPLHLDMTYGPALEALAERFGRSASSLIKG